ncbi:hypothetical protein M0208_06375 [Sphingomonas sp. SUN019]|uniref:hypothetical protein n=1 Tax=Sphingomonas sp. SUN019 TaxID=2937788 RepID=UPI00216437FC|nr:hypothetical protein [Sphingomonas sp. SUN019]UVO50162.1 hypothetical protein M0208_06375 [Sphingomonas sp. SUN019]
MTVAAFDQYYDQPVLAHGSSRHGATALYGSPVSVLAAEPPAGLGLAVTIAGASLTVAACAAALVVASPGGAGVGGASS